MASSKTTSASSTTTPKKAGSSSSSKSKGNKRSIWFSWVASEALGCASVMLVLIPLCTVLEKKGHWIPSWVVHFLAVIAFDMAFAATLSPNFCIGFLLLQKMPFVEAFIRAGTDLGVGLACAVTLGYTGLLTIQPPALARGLSLDEGFLIEAALTCGFFLVVLFISNVIPTFSVRRPLVAVTLRTLITLGGPYSGAFMNPMVALPFAWYTDTLTPDFYLVYCAGPLAGTLAAILLWIVIERLTGVKEIVYKPPRVKKSKTH